MDDLGRGRLGLDPVTTEPYGVLDVGMSAPMLEFRGHNGTAFALPYPMLESLAFDPVGGVLIQFREHRIEVSGRNLRPLYEGLLRHEVSFIQESDLDFKSEAATFVDKIKVSRIDDLV